MPDAAWVRSLQRRLLRWFARSARDLPWRKTREPYRIWVSEIMLQQTQVASVTGYYDRFLRAFPDVKSLAAASEQDVLRLWEGLGYYRRARQLHAAARRIVELHGGAFPREFDQVLDLPGVGRYTAGAVLSIAHDARHPILEANTIRLFSRLLGSSLNPASAAGQRLLWALAEHILPRRSVGQFNQALMELGSEVCTPRQPACTRCPLMTLCAACRLGRQEELPVSARPLRYEARHEAAVIARRRGRVLLRQCGPGEWWTGLWDFPRFQLPELAGPELAGELSARMLELTGLRILPGPAVATLRHQVTRYRITLVCHEATVLSGRLIAPACLQWVAPERLSELPLSVTGRRISRLLKL
ncbi:MAG: A/G-specific adenine glycosylase [Pirellulaceae bacterium]|nr:A/G-specific adenine glycosylase [Pirellulaceae bacterium]